LKVKEFEGNPIIISKPELKNQTFVASTSFSAPIDLEKASSILGSAIYEPEQFPGLIYKMEEPKVEILLFASGKLVCTATKEEDVYDALQKLKALLTKKS
jgi:transcription initiation factor TFIID TATA-box-binding protein